ncbi:hypothetical protein FQZ97_623860 [compost metagenome]
MADHRLTLLTQQRNKAGFLSNQRVDVGGFKIEVGRYLTLFFQAWDRNLKFIDIPLKQMRNTHSTFKHLNRIFQVRTLEHILQVNTIKIRPRTNNRNRAIHGGSSLQYPDYINSP